MVGADLFRDILRRDRRMKRLPPAGSLVWWERIYSAMFYVEIAASSGSQQWESSVVGADLFRDVLCRDRRVKRLQPAGLVWWERIYSAMFYVEIAASSGSHPRG
ncbi:hypothetical protein B1L02_18645 [Pseudoalteromonas piscicida]|nr:hypothetical protein B1L02_18645 [Pseudoalteromonas piscicida]